MRQRSSYLTSQIAQEFEFQARLSHGSVEPEAITRSILNWTEGQPFLTYRLYPLVLRSPQLQRASAGLTGSLAEYGSAECDPAPWIDQLIQSYCVQRCADPELTKHLRHICKAILEDAQSLQLLETYQHVLEGYRLSSKAPNSQQYRLIQMGLLRIEGNQLVIGNRLYRSIFNQTWLDRAFRTVYRHQLAPFSAHLKGSPSHISSSSVSPDPSVSFNNGPNHNGPNPGLLSSLPTTGLPMTASFNADSPQPPAPRPKTAAHSDLNHRAIAGLAGRRSAFLIGLALVACTMGALATVLITYTNQESGVTPPSLRLTLTQDKLSDR